MYKIMSNHCTYPEIHYEALEPTILVEESVIWDEDNSNIHEQETLNYTNSANNTLTEVGNDSYVTASGDNTTQYFSILESSNQTILNDITDATINNSVIQEGDIGETPAEESACIDINNGQVVLFKVDGSDELYGFQLIHDEGGGLQKYQFKVRQNIEGNLEAIPETLQVLPVENFGTEDTADDGVADNVETSENTHNLLQEKERSILVKEEHTGEHLPSQINQEEILEEQLDTKEGILEVVTAPINQKQELQEEVSNVESHDYDATVHSPLTEDNAHEMGEEEEEEEEEIYYTHEDSVDENNFTYSDGITDDTVPEDETPASEGHYEQLFVKESHLIDDTNGGAEANGVEETEHLNESDNEEYETVEGVHVTGDVDENIYTNSDIRKSPSYQASTIASRKKIIKNVIRKVRIQKNDGRAVYYVIKNPEKENMGRVIGNSTAIKPNPRSILKCSITAMEPQKYEEEEEKYDKRFAKSKEAQQARQFHNFIAQTKIIHAPVRQGRLPRKQQITPMQRTDEEIVVQEVVVSSNGFIETSEQGVLKERAQLKPTEYIQLSDSDEDFDPKSPHKKKRKGKKKRPMVEITISDTEDESSDESVRDADDEQNSEKETVATQATLKRPRGRPPKHQDKEEDKEITKRPRGRPPKHPRPQAREPEEEIIVIKIDNKCPKCPKSFPSEGSLRSHMQYHNFCQIKSSDPKYMCEKCGDTFKNSFLLNRHIDSHKNSNITCVICKKVFNDQAQLLAHRKTHIKQQMFKNTTLPKDSPKATRILNKNKCLDCGKLFSNTSALNIHQKQHKLLFCQSCKMAFSSKFILGNHLRLECVKRSRSPKKQPYKNKKERLITRQSSIPTLRKEEVPIFKPSIPASTAVITNIKCDSCSMTFATYTSLFKHKVLKHGLDSPDKSIVKRPIRKSVHKNRSAHSGVRPSIGLKNAFVGLQSKLEAFKNSQKKNE